jgi:hypothetical protein
MANSDDQLSLADVGAKVLHWLWEASAQSETVRWLVVVGAGLLLVALVFAGLVYAIAKLIEGLAKLADIYKGSGLPLPLGRANALKVRRRIQFCKVIAADLSYISKAENWNDQYFTDLEAEVETEGGYYASAAHRLIRRRSFGLRRVASLIRAITSSTEKVIQLIGEPGAGKSVAMRHLAAQLAARGAKSKATKALVPLYVNLRELDVAVGEAITADLIRRFVFDNIRRGDPDTSAFVRENWDEYRTNGNWFFLLDSFDEIPAILHAEAGSEVADSYAQAIRIFLDGMGECRGVLASREFKGPVSLPWKKFKIVSLGIDRQLKLVRNAFLTDDQEKTVQDHLVSSNALIGATPLFLTLLCRYVKDEGRAPTNDTDLLGLHITRLANRDPRYLVRMYSLTPDELLSGAAWIAKLFAEDETIGLAPTVEQIQQKCDLASIPKGNLEQLIAALVDCKIGRADVPNIAYGERRFAFSHRRYQEALFIQFLKANPDHISKRDLLTVSRWREYAVTLLQTEGQVFLGEILTEAANLLREIAKTQKPKAASFQFSDGYGFFEWSGSVEKYVLELLHEGLIRRLDEVPNYLSEAVKNILEPRWENGDALDCYQVVALGALLPSPSLSRYLSKLFQFGTSSGEAIAFQQTAALRGDTSRVIQRSVLKRLANETIEANENEVLLRLRAFAARLPEKFGANLVYRRCLAIRRPIRLVYKLFRPFVPKRFVNLLSPNLAEEAGLHGTGRLPALPIAAVLLFGMAVFVGIFLGSIIGQAKASNEITASLTPIEILLKGDFSFLADWWSRASLLERLPIFAWAAMVFVYILLCAIFVLRAVGEPLGPKFFIQLIKNVSRYRSEFRRFLRLLLVVILTFALIFGLGHFFIFLGSILGIYELPAHPFIVGLFAAGFIAALDIMGRQFRLRVLQVTGRRHVKKLRSGDASDLELICGLSTLEQVVVVLSQDDALLTKNHDARSLSAYLMSYVREDPSLKGQYDPEWAFQEMSWSTMRRCVEILDERCATS